MYYTHLNCNCYREEELVLVQLNIYCTKIETQWQQCDWVKIHIHLERENTSVASLSTYTIFIHCGNFPCVNSHKRKCTLSLFSIWQYVFFSFLVFNYFCLQLLFFSLSREMKQHQQKEQHSLPLSIFCNFASKMNKASVLCGSTYIYIGTLLLPSTILIISLHHQEKIKGIIKMYILEKNCSLVLLHLQHQ